jgi:hypothetical protein
MKKDLPICIAGDTLKISHIDAEGKFIGEMLFEDNRNNLSTFDIPTLLKFKSGCIVTFSDYKKITAEIDKEILSRKLEKL